MKSLFALLCAAFVFNASAETVKDREGAVRGDRAAMENDARWIYNDWQRGFDRAKATGKPLLVVLRCVPCLACAGIDASVLTEPDLQPLLDKFVCVRVINANALDLSLFQFDYDLSFSTIFFSGDGTVYGRYGSWMHQKAPQEKTTSGYKKALEEALKLHKRYPANKGELAGKQPTAFPFKDPLQAPALAGKYKRDLDWGGKVVQSCVHCHQIGDAVRSYYHAETKRVPLEWVYPMPALDTIGAALAPEEIARVQSVATGSIAEKAGFKVGDEIVALAGQPMISMADVSWALHHAPESGSLKASVIRDGAEKELAINLPSGWRMKSDISRRVGTWEMRAMALGGLLLENLTDAQRAERNLPKDTPALLIKHAGEYGVHAAAKKAGFRKDDLIVEIDGIREPITESELIGRILESHKPGDQIAAVVLRGGEKVTLSLPVQ